MVISGFIACASIKTLIGLQNSSSFSLRLNLFMLSSSNFTAAKVWKCSGINNFSLKLFLLFLLKLIKSYSGLNVTFQPFSFFDSFV